MIRSNCSIKLLLVRHGEREDEVADREYWNRQKLIWKSIRKNLPRNYAKTSLSSAIKSKLINLEPYPLVDTLDPLLTTEGHEQAQASFQSISAALPQSSRIAVFTSPLRRTIGTALTMGTVPFSNNLHWECPVHPSADTSGIASLSTNGLSPEGGGEDREDPDSIPITVLNGLGDFAARVNKIGGSGVLVPNGLVRCGTMPKNNGSEDSPFVRALKNMPIPHYEHRSNTSKVEFWAPDGSRMSCAMDPSTMEYHPETYNEKLYERNKQDVIYRKVREKSAMKPSRNCHAPPPPDPIEAVNDAIRATAARGCDTCIIVAHREAIRDLKELCNHHRSLRLPYCAIGTFAATLVDCCVGEKPKVLYHFWCCCPFQRFGTHAIPQPLQRHPDFVLLMTDAFGNGETSCIGRFRNDTCAFSFPTQVWLDAVEKKDFLAFPKNESLSVNVVISNESECDILTRGYAQSLEADGLLLSFDSVVYFDASISDAPTPKHRFWLLSHEMTGTNITMRYVQL